MFISIISDCRDGNAFSRQSVRVASLFGHPPCCIGIKNDAEASGNLIDILDASQGLEGIILVNVAPRHGSAKRWPNGTPFGYFWHKKTLVCASLDGQTLSLAKQLNLLDGLCVFDIPTVTAWAVKECLLDESQGQMINNTQFRSLEFLPRAAKWVWEKRPVPQAVFDLSQISEPTQPIWWIDCFGNMKTSFQEHELVQANEWLKQEVPYYPRLKDVPNGELAWVLGSSGLGTHRFLELVIQGGNASEKIMKETS